ncbi:hypothetical protein [Vulcanisaeta thermophila]|uniref:hypothetical protein n=1 Tax=Vulcanisaeta thermophila TaxID=867917 RepID=UPI000852A020|nr:hypothetical protein [Vulcanisaeta thermophila]
MYVTYLPWHVELSNGIKVRVRLSQLINSSSDIYALKVPINEIQRVYREFISRGFHRAIPSINKGEIYGLAKMIRDPWELHVRIFSNGLIKGEVEISRRYLEHLIGGRINNVVYEIYEVIREVTSNGEIIYLPLNQRVINVIENVRIELKQPRLLIPWGLEVFRSMASLLDRLWH